ncbi:MAG: hypothetical protein OEZ39_17790 [Gammaproteobacteria bacterium]|nr:hypothetical protein [Gammaproteobacteria bacterium]
MHNVIGPDFDEADLVSFDFGDVDFIMRLPEHSERDGRKFLAPTNLAQISDENWDFIAEDGSKIKNLTTHCWLYKDKSNDDDVFLTHLDIILKELPHTAQQQFAPLNKQALCKWIVNALHDSVADMEMQAIKDWNRPSSTGRSLPRSQTWRLSNVTKQTGSPPHSVMKVWVTQNNIFSFH